MKSFLTATAALALLTAAPFAAQAATIVTTRVVDPGTQLETAALPPWMQDDGSSSDHPIPMPGDRSGEALNTQYRDGITVITPPGAPPPPGFAPVPLR